MLRRYRLVLSASVGIVLVSLIALGINGLLLYRSMMQALALTTPIQAKINSQDFPGACRNTEQAAAQWQRVATFNRPLAPVMRRVGWMPLLGADLRALPEAIELAQHGTAAGVTACTMMQPVVATDPGPQRVAALATTLSKSSEQLAGLQDQLAAAERAYSALEPLIDRSPRLAPYKPQLTALGARLPTVLEGLQSVAQIAPDADWLLGVESPRRYLLVVQNPLELRPTGGFIGLACVVRVINAQPSVEECRPSEAYTTPAALDMPMPFPYSRYLRLGQYYLRDANWSPDFPSTARTIQKFWALNRQAQVDGVIAVDPYALAPLLNVTGPLTLEDGTQISAEQVMDVSLARYYDGSVYRNKSLVAQMLPALLDRLRAVDVAQLPQLAEAVRISLNEQHILVALNQPKLAATLDSRGWSGALPERNGDVVRVVDADVGYGAVNAFVERLTQYDVALDDTGVPSTAILTLTYTNRYSPWAEAPTAYAVNGYCTDSYTLQSTRQLGCYANFLRVYVPLGSQLINVTGLEETLGVDQEHGRTVFGGYLRVNAGEQKTVQFHYKLPAVAPGTLVIEKQPGTLNNPIMVAARTADQQATMYVAGRADVTLGYQLAPDKIAITGAFDAEAERAFARNTAHAQAVALWQAGERDPALATWREGNVFDRALDYARFRAANGSGEDALALISAIAPMSADGRAAFEYATLLAAQGQADKADQWFKQAAEQAPANPLAQLTWASRQAALDQSLSALSNVSVSSSAVRRWRAAATTFEQSGDLGQAVAYQAVLLHITPDDRALALRYADLLAKTQRNEAAVTQYTALTRQSDLWGRLAQARLAQFNNDRSRAALLYAEALPLADTYQVAFGIGDGLRDLGDIQGALQAYERAAALPPGSIWPLLAAGNMLRGSDPATAQAWYTRAQQLDPGSGYPDFALGTLWLEQGNRAAALPLLTAAAGKQPDVSLFRETLAQASQ